MSRQKWRPFWIFEIFAKIAKHKNAYISKTVLDRAISKKFLTHRVSLQSSYPNFEKNFCLAKNGGHFEFSNFSQKLKKIKMVISRKPCKIERFRRNFLPTGYICRVAMPIFKKILSRQKWRPFWIFEFFAKIAKHKNAYISKTLLDRAISTKFLTRRISLQSSHANFQTKNFSQNMAALLNFRIFRKNCKTQKCLYLENRAR